MCKVVTISVYASVLYMCKYIAYIYAMPMHGQARDLPLGISTFLFLEIGFSLNWKHKLAR